MKTSEQGLALIRKSEGFSARAYVCPAGRPTIGYGHVIRPGEFYPNCINEEEAEELLVEDVAFTEQAVNRLVTVSIGQNQFDALVDFAYNVGTKAFEKSTLLKMLNEGNPAACQQFERWIYAGGRKLDGLIARRAAEMALFSQNPQNLEKLS